LIVLDCQINFDVLTAELCADAIFKNCLVSSTQTSTGNSVVNFYDSYYSGMEISQCVNITYTKSRPYSQHWWCFFQFGDGNNPIYAIPVFYPEGSVNSHKLCDCTTAYGSSAECNAFNFIVGFIMYPHAVSSDGEPLIVELMGLYRTPSDLNRAAFDAVSASTKSSSSNYEFCVLPSNKASCTILVYSVASNSQVINQVNDFFFLSLIILSLI